MILKIWLFEIIYYQKDNQENIFKIVYTSGLKMKRT